MTHPYCERNGHSYTASVTEANADYAGDGVLFSVRGVLACGVCREETRVYDLAAEDRAAPVRRLARLHAGSADAGRQPRPMSESFALWALESYGVDAGRVFPSGLGWEHALFAVRASGDMLVTLEKTGTDPVAGEVWTVTARQLARLPEPDPRLSAVPGEIIQLTAGDLQRTARAAAGGPPARARGRGRGGGAETRPRPAKPAEDSGETASPGNERGTPGPGPARRKTPPNAAAPAVPPGGTPAPGVARRRPTR